MSWGIEKKKGKPFRPAMQLSTGELASIGGITVMQTATASCKTVRTLQSEFPEIRSWLKILNVPYRPNISLIIPPPEIIPSRYQDLLDPFVKRIVEFGENHLILVRSINSGTDIYFHLLKLLHPTSGGKKMLAFYHSTTSDKRKIEILKDLRLPMGHPDKMLKAVVATISLSVGVDIRVKNVVSLGLGSSPEEIVQESGRCLRGKQEESAGLRGLAFFFQKGSIAAIHCPVSSECRYLISDPLPRCQTTSLFRFFDSEFESESAPCDCCYSCIARDASLGCERCLTFLEVYLSKKKTKVPSRSVVKKLKTSIMDLFRGLDMCFVPVESRLHLAVKNFSTDFIRAFDEIREAHDIRDMWHVSEELAVNLYNVAMEVLEDSDFYEDAVEEIEECEPSDSSEYTENSTEDSNDESSSEDE